jgi:aryl-alcohol dehydrogenase-like predicted oxidoreductase
MEALRQQGKIRAVGVSNYDPEQMEAFRRTGEIHVCQPPYNIFERDIEAEIMPYCRDNNIALMTYGALCRGFLSGKMSHDRKFEGDDLRKIDPKFQDPRFSRYLMAAERLAQLARDHAGKPLLPAAIRWILDQGIDIAIWGGRRPDQMAPIDAVFGWQVDEGFKSAVDDILEECLQDPVGPEFMAPPSGKTRDHKESFK